MALTVIASRLPDMPVTDQANVLLVEIAGW